jgi:hypothetical protein
MCAHREWKRQWETKGEMEDEYLALCPGDGSGSSLKGRSLSAIQLVGPTKMPSWPAAPSRDSGTMTSIATKELHRPIPQSPDRHATFTALTPLPPIPLLLQCQRSQGTLPRQLEGQLAGPHQKMKS